MYLKKIEIKGFKSFSDKVIVNFDKGLNVITGPNGSGKCIVEDEVIKLPYAEIKVNELFNEVQNNFKYVLLSEKNIDYIIPLEEIPILTLDPVSLKLTQSKILTMMRKKYNGKIVEIVGENGTKIRTTMEHKVLTRKKWKEARDIKIGDEILCSLYKPSWERVVDAKIVDYSGYVFDVYLSKLHNYLIGKNGVVVHNSNIIDAIKFVLGENNARLLRSDKLVNLISDNLRNKNVKAYVRIYLDNRDRKIPIEEDEVVISRYINENGETDFYINKKKATKIAIQNLLSMAGLYVRGYNIVMQGEISRISERTPEEIRKLIEEAIGLSSYDEKKAEAEEQLKEAEINLRIAMSKLEEVRNRILQLEEELNKKIARKNLEEILQKLKVSLLRKELNEKMKNKEEIEALLNNYKKELENVEKNLSEKREEYEKIVAQTIAKKREDLLEKIYNELNNMNRNLREKRNELYLLKVQESELREKMAAEKNLLQENRSKIVDLKTEMRKVNDKLKIKKKRLKEIKRETYLNKAKTASIQAGIRKLNIKIKELNEELEKIEKELKQQEFEIEKRKKLILEFTIKSNTIRKEIKKNKKKIKEIELKRKFVERKITKLNEKLNKKLKELEEIRRLIKRKTEEIEYIIEENKRIDELRREVEEKAKKQYNEIMEEKRKREVARLVAETMKNAGINVLGILIDLITFNKEDENKIEMLLEDLVNAIVIGENEDIYTISEILSSLKIDNIYIIKLSKCGENNASDLNLFESKIPGLKESLKKILGEKIVVGESREDCVVLKENIKIDKGVLAKIRVNRSSRNYERVVEALEKLEKLKEMEKEIIVEEVMIEEEKVEKLEKDLNNLKNEILDTESKLVKTRKNEEKLRNHVLKIKNEISVLKNMLIENERKINILTKERNNIMKKYAKNMKRKITIQKMLTILNRKIRKVNSENQKLHEVYQNLEIEKENILKSIDELKEKFFEIKKEKRKEKERILRIVSDLNYNKMKCSTVMERISEDNEAIKKLEDSMKELEIRIKEITSKSSDEEVKRIETLKVEISELEKKRNELYSEIMEKDRILQQISFEANTIENKLREMSNIKVSEELEDAESIMEMIEEEISSIGDVNMLADTHYKEQSKNYSIVVERLNKLEEEKRSILEFISEIENKKKNAFMDALKIVNDAFNKYFNSMNGGSAWLELENPEDPFKGGVNIIVHFPNKYPRPIYGCSGGEKSVTSLCFIFAMQHLRPAPFYLFDEIDAHLDPVNVQNYVKLLKSRSRETQHIVISLKDIVASKADKVVGVFMKNGKTKLVELPKLIKLEDKG